MVLGMVFHLGDEKLQTFSVVIMNRIVPTGGRDRAQR